MTKEQRKNLERLLRQAQNKQEVYWDSLRTLETALGFDLDDVAELSQYTVDDLLELR